MSVVRRFLLAPSLVRLIRKERGGARITEGYFAPQGGRVSFVRVDGQQCHLVLIAKDKGGALSEERTEVPRAHGDALLDVCPGKAAYERTSLQLGGREALIDRYVSPGSLDIVSVAFEDDGEARGFAAPAWFGREVTDEEAYDRQTVALQGPPQGGEITLSNAALDAVLDLLEPRFGFGRYNAPARGPEPRPESRPEPRPAPRVEAKPESRPEAKPEPKPEPRLESGALVAAPAAVAAAAPEPAPPPAEAPATPAEANAASDARIDDVIESLSQALGAAIQQPAGNEASQPEDPVAAFERWTVRPRRTQPQT